jgi:DNA-binding CsgD family transcriptional regulator
MFKKNDLAFMTLFDEVFPDFSRKLIEINPNLVQSEIEFCALIKLKIQAKDIARYRYLAHRTIQNKKYLIRKKLNIPKGVDIYQFFNDL